MKTVAVLVGSARKVSINRQLAQNIARLAEGKLHLDFVQIDDLPMYNPDLTKDEPASVTRFKEDIARADAMLVVTPEFNRFFTPLIKNAIDWGSKPMNNNVFSGKPAAAMGATPGAMGAMAGVLSTVQLLGIVGCAVMAAPGVYFSHKPEHHDDDGLLIDPSAQEFLRGWVDAFEVWIEKLA